MIAALMPDKPDNIFAINPELSGDHKNPKLKEYV